MVNGKPGDHPINDLLDHGIPVFSPEADSLVRQIAELVSRYRLWDWVDWFSPPPVEELAAERRIRDELVQDARDRGWEV
jgi:hypothetical protein